MYLVINGGSHAMGKAPNFFRTFYFSQKPFIDGMSYMPVL